MFKCKYFKIHELVSPNVYKERGERAWQLLDIKLLITLDDLREHYGPMTVNNYLWGGKREYSGLRLPGDPYYSKYSQHSFGRAADCLFANHAAKKVRKDILNREKRSDFRFAYIGAIELDVSWFHFDVRNNSGILTFRPK